MLHGIHSIYCTYTDVFSMYMYTACIELVHSWQRMHGLNSDCRNTNDQTESTFIHIFASQRSILHYNREKWEPYKYSYQYNWKWSRLEQLSGQNKRKILAFSIRRLLKRAKWRPRRDEDGREILFYFILFTNFAKDNLAGEISQNYCPNNETPKHAKKRKKKPVN